MPPASTTSCRPSMTTSAACATAASPDRHSSLSVAAGTGTRTTYGGQPDRVGAGACLDHTAHDHGVDVRPARPRATERLPDDDPAEVGGVELGEGAAPSADRRAGPGDEYRLFHVSWTVDG